MVNGCPEAIKQAVIVDLDGTLIAGNSFRLYLLRATQAAIRTCRLWTAARVTVLVAARKVRLISHHTLKQNALKITTKIADADFIMQLTGELKSMIRHEVITRTTECHNQGMLTVLATAAPAIYAESFGKACGMDHTLCTTDKELEGEAKANAVAALMKATGAEPALIITDRLPDGRIPDAPLLARYPDAEMKVIGTTEKSR